MNDETLKFEKKSNREVFNNKFYDEKEKDGEIEGDGERGERERGGREKEKAFSALSIFLHCVVNPLGVKRSQLIKLVVQ